MRIGRGSVYAAFDGVRTYDQPSIAAQVDRIRAEIRQDGESCAGCEELRLLCPAEASEKQQKIGIEEIAEWEGWTFEYLPDGSVRFTPLSTNTATAVGSP